MSPNIFQHICLSLVLFFSIISDSQQLLYPYHLVVGKTLKDLDLKSLEGHWFGVYHRNAKNDGEVCPELDIRVGTNGDYVNVTESQGDTIKFQQKMEQNQHLKGKISQIVKHPEGYETEMPWFITQIDPVLVVYQVTTGSKKDDNWSVYSRTETLDEDIVELGANKLIEAGAVADHNGKYGYHCSD